MGLWRPADDDAYFLGDPLELDGVHQDGQVTSRGPLVALERTWLPAPRRDQLDLEWRGLPSIDGLQVDRVDALRRASRGSSRSSGPPCRGREVSVLTDLPAILASAGDPSSSAAAGSPC